MLKELVKHSVAYYMADVLEANMNDDGDISAAGFLELHDIFGDVPSEDRASVYLTLLELLDERGIPFDNEQAVA